MNKRHFKELAAILARADSLYLNRPNATPRNAIDYIREEIEALCRADNPNFDVNRFRVACGLREDESK